MFSRQSVKCYKNTSIPRCQIVCANNSSIGRKHLIGQITNVLFYSSALAHRASVLTHSHAPIILLLHGCRKSQYSYDRSDSSHETVRRTVSCAPYTTMNTYSRTNMDENLASRPSEQMFHTRNTVQEYLLKPDLGQQDVYQISSADVHCFTNSVRTWTNSVGHRRPHHH